MSTYSFDKLKAYSDNNGNYVTLDEKQLQQFEQLCSLLIERNKTTNLTAITKPEDIEVKHFIDSLTGVDMIKKHSDGELFSLIDIGCGAG